MKRILVALPVLTSVDVIHRCVAELALAEGSSITAVTAVRNDAWRESLPSVITPGLGAALADMRPWRTADEPITRIERRFSQLCEEAGIQVEIDQNNLPPEQRLIQLAPFHDILVTGLPPIGNHESDRVLQRELPASGGGIPVVRIADRPSPVRRVLILLTGDRSSLRALRCFLHLRPWPDAEVFVAGYGLPPEQAELATIFCQAHGIPAVLFRQTEPDVIFDWTLRERIDSIVTGWSWFHGSELTTRSADEVLPSLFLAP